MRTLLDTLMQRRRAWAVMLVCLVLGGLAIGVLGEAERDASATDSAPVGADSTEVVELQQRFEEDDESTAIALFASDGQLGRETLAELGDRLTAAAEAVGAPAPGGQGGEEGGPPSGLVPSEDGTAAFGIIEVPGAGATAISDKVEQLRDILGEGLPEGVTAQLTGPAAVQADLAAVFDGANFRLLAATASVVAVLLIVTYRSPFLWLVPLLVVGVGDRAAASVATHTLKLFDVKWDESTVGILSVLVFGAGTNYALLLISRYRDELRVHEDRYAAMRQAVRRTAEPVLASSTTVLVGLLSLLLSLIPTTRGLGLACSVGIAIAAFSSLVALPFTLVHFPRGIFWPKTPRVGQTTLVETTGSAWRRVGNAVAKRPVVFILATLVLVGALAGGTSQLRSGLSQADQFLDKPEAIAASERLAESFPAGSSDPATVITTASAGDISGALQQLDGVTAVRPSGEADGLTRVDVVLEAAPGSEEARETVEQMRTALSGFDDTYVGGTAAAALDESEATERDRLLIIPLILGLVIVALVLLLRSLVAPLILVASVVATYFAALGSSWWIFTRVLDFEALDTSVPLLSFLFLVALGVDYNIFLVTRASEEAKGHGTREGMLRALTATGGVITSAGILLAAVFAVLGVLPLVVLAQIGVVICIGVLLDTLIVRTVFVPAVAIALGDRFWWPRKIRPDGDRQPEGVARPADSVTV